MKIEIRINGRLYTEATFPATDNEWAEVGYRPTEAMVRAFHAIREDVLRNTRWTQIYGAAGEPRTVRPVQSSGTDRETAKLIESHLDAMVRIAGIVATNFCGLEAQQQIGDIISEHDAAQEAIRHPNLE